MIASVRPERVDVLVAVALDVFDTDVVTHLRAGGEIAGTEVAEEGVRRGVVETGLAIGIAHGGHEVADKRLAIVDLAGVNFHRTTGADWGAPSLMQGKKIHRLGISSRVLTRQGRIAERGFRREDAPVELQATLGEVEDMAFRIDGNAGQRLDVRRRDRGGELGEIGGVPEPKRLFGTGGTPAAPDPCRRDAREAEVYDEARRRFRHDARVDVLRPGRGDVLDLRVS